TELNPCRGYLGSVGNRLQFGFGSVTKIDSIRIVWPDHTMQLIVNPAIDKLIPVAYKKGLPGWDFEVAKNPVLFENVTTGLSEHGIIDFTHQETDFIDFNEFRLLPHKFSQYGPSLAVGDVNGDKLEDVFIAGSKGFDGRILLQDVSGKFSVHALNGDPVGSALQKENAAKVQEDQGSLLADFDRDGHIDLYIVSGGVESSADPSGYLDRVYHNSGSGSFRLTDPSVVFAATPEQFKAGKISGASVRAADIDNDGDLDLVRSSRIIPGQYPVSASTIILRNDSRPGQIIFTDITAKSAPSLTNIGLVTDAMFADIDKDGTVDLILVGEWMAPVILKNNKGVFTDITAASGLAKETGWWNSIVAGDFDNDGDIDFVFGNNGTNTVYQASVSEPAGIYAKDFNKDGIYDAIPTLYLQDSTGERREYPAFGRDEMMKQIIQVRRKYPTFRDFALTSMGQIFTPEELQGAVIKHAVNLTTSYIENLGGGKFKIEPLPVEAQFAPVFGMVAQDVNGDGKTDLVLNGNDFGVELSVGKCAAMNGLVMLGDGRGSFKALKPGVSGIYIPGNGKALAWLKGTAGAPLLLASQNNGRLLAFRDNVNKQK
ncbi:MAG: FG-GAP-like repeat-containing protein, partial [Flavitalea sp.]